MGKTVKQLSRRARKLLDRIHGGQFYKWTPEPGPVMQELLDAGFIGTSGRVVLIERCYVPRGFKSISKETYPSWTCAHLETRSHEQSNVNGEFKETWESCKACGFTKNYVAVAIPKQVTDVNAPIKKAFSFGSLLK